MPRVSFSQSSPQTCPGCRQEIAEQSAIHAMTPTPRPGDVSICVFCATVNRFDDKLVLYALPREEWVLLDPEVQVLINNARRAVRKVE